MAKIQRYVVFERNAFRPTLEYLSAVKPFTEYSSWITQGLRLTFKQATYWRNQFNKERSPTSSSVYGIKEID
jgi:hypothetical protein